MSSTTSTPAPPLERPSERDYPPIARAGWPIIAWIFLGAIAAAAIAWLSAGRVAGSVVGAAGLIVAAWSVWFFRDPPRKTPDEPGVVVSGADGVVCFVGPDQPPPELGLPSDVTSGMTRISVFMNIFNVHVNRAPVAGRVTALTYRAGKFFNASLDKASIHNERCAMALRTPDRHTVVVAQIAGLIARRIVCGAAIGQEYRAGERFGLIRFGSRVDVYLPAGVTTSMKVGDRTVAGETVFAHLTSTNTGDHA